MMPRGRRPLEWSGWPRRLALAAAAFLLLWIGALLRFAAELPRHVASLAEESDGIVVLTGGAARLDVGIELLAAKKAKRMLITGVNPGLSKADMPARSGNAALFDCCVDIGFALDTVGNAEESAAWAKTNGFKRLRVVTASYHMPRSLLEFERRIPDVALLAHPVFPEHVKLDRWWMWPGTAALLAGEFQKYLAVLARARGAALLAAVVPQAGGA
jgi:uncharacterized SAM-binding protein YcdF (DUF218 family)